MSPKQFIQAYSVCTTVFSSVDLATLNGDSPRWAAADDASAKWLADKKHILARPLALETLDPNVEHYAGMVVPDGDGFYFEPRNLKIRSFLEYFVKFRKPVCLIGAGAAALFSTEPDPGEQWLLRKYSLTAPSNLSAVRHNKYLTHRSIEDFIVDMYGRYSTGKNESVHIVVDDNLVTAQSKACTLIAIQTFILLCNR
ncbi:Glutamine amidotransferase-like class 1 domain-containing protein 1 [Polyrhizophydium stewartii]|uniref:Glutamine amidotransferase-like class 1 domain-containing protein 1 n=1 Tax=Polyrhizophydium stewartii TaxID=2732419 RepID=A0ABR4N4L8_9FUNG|nr:Glutamine amidotransferase-like class 1 domain-containing protein 1 [Polyrhizophydium stewartii]